MEKLTDIINGWTFEGTIKTAESLMEAEKNMFKWDVLRHLRDFAENYRERAKGFQHLEEQGRLIKLPCKVGDAVYAYCGEFGILEYEVDSIVIDKHITYQCSAYSEPIRDCPSECLDEIEPDISDFGKTVFLTKSEAEAKLKELRGGESE